MPQSSTPKPNGEDQSRDKSTASHPDGEDPTIDQATDPDSKIDHAASIKYWESVPATSSGMLGTVGNLTWYSRIDLRGSHSFLSKVRWRQSRSRGDQLPLGDKITLDKLTLGVDCGAGVGRVTEGFLSRVCETVDIVEPVKKLTDALQEGSLSSTGVIGDIYNVGLENWNPGKKYDLIWIQWCVGHLRDEQLTDFIVRCRDSLTEDGLVVLKENESTGGLDIFDDEDSSVTRTDEKFRKIFESAGMTVIRSEIQLGIPKRYNLMPVQMYALRPTI